MTRSASLLFTVSEQSEADKVDRLLRFFGISEKRLDPGGVPNAPAGDAPRSRLLASASAFLRLIEALEGTTSGAEIWRRDFHSAFVYAVGDTDAIRTLAARLANDDGAAIAEVPAGMPWRVTDALGDFCRSMSGVEVRSNRCTSDQAIVLDRSTAKATPIVSCEVGAAVIKVVYREVPVFLSTARSIVDVDAALVSVSFDIRDFFLQAAPVVMYVRWAFEGHCWHASSTCACLVIDDPPLKPRYGFLDFTRLLDLMKTHGFSTSIAFIPWNWRRSTTGVTRLFRENPSRLSLSVHGCDHTGGEFGGGNRERLAWRARQALERMARHEARTGIPFDSVMVFPQGVFSREAMTVLKRSGFVAAVNTEVASSDPPPHNVTVADYWDVAVMSHGDFAVFTRRYPEQGVANFAFDVLLGKPCLVVVHHEDFREGGTPLVQFIDSLNALNARLSWCSLGEVVRRSCRQRHVESGLLDLEMYGSELWLHNSSAEYAKLRVSRREARPAEVDAIRVGDASLDWEAAGGRLTFEVGLAPGESQSVKIVYFELPGVSLHGESLRYRAKAMVRRYLSELRDNYVTRRPFSA